MEPVVLAAKVWHYWISIFLVVPIALVLIALGVGYFRKVVSMKPPKR